jgi:CheY-like chemotaxis protein
MGERRLCVLVVDDDSGVRDSLVQLFEDEGYEVHSAENGLDALDRMKRIRPAIVILDLMMPVMTGWELHRHMKSDPALSSIPVCILSASTTRPPEAECVLHKPTTATKLLDAVHEHATTA